MSQHVAVIIGAGGMGAAIAQRVGSHHTLLLADYNQATLDATASSLSGHGFTVRTQTVDVSDAESVEALAQAASDLGPVTRVVHTAGVSPVHSTIDSVIAIDLMGTAHVLASFGEVMADGGAGVFIASMSGYLVPPLDPATAAAIATATSDELAQMPVAQASTYDDPGRAYAATKQANIVMVRGASRTWGARGARVNSISPGVVATGMGNDELAGESGAFMRAMVEASGTGRVGTPDEIGDAVQFLVSDAAGFITGIDLLVDGGAVAAVSTGALAGARG